MNQIIDKIKRKIIIEYSDFRRNTLNSEGIDVMSHDWDNLIILDGCRYDLFQNTNHIDGRLSKKISKGSSTPEFLNENFSNSSIFDTVYVCAIPMIEEQGVHTNFFDTIRVWREDWDSELNTVRPESTKEHAIQTHEKYPNKRLIIHFLQPHYPFIGPTGQNISHSTVSGPGVPEDTEDNEYVWAKLQSGKISKQRVWKAYKENLNRVLPYVEQLDQILPGKTVVTSDHGNGFGEWGIYGHPTYQSLYTHELVAVPWLIIESDDRRKITTGNAYQGETAGSDRLEKRLEHLGYVD